jgi:mannose-6-phosphate isomerase-like protein (cupin superfamily)
MAAQGVFTLELNDKPEYQRILEGKPQTYGMRSGRVYLESGKACGQHSTKNHEELLIFLAGQGELLIGDSARHPVGVGKVAYIPPETVHDVQNTGPGALIYIYCVAPAGA